MLATLSLKGRGILWRHALRDLRGGWRRLRLLFLCLALGVAVMSCIGSMVSALKAGIDRDAKSLLGGDVEIRQLYKPAGERLGMHAELTGGTVSRALDMRAMAENLPGKGGNRTLVELKGVDKAYPLYGTLDLNEERDPVFYNDTGHKLFGAAVGQSLLDMLNLKVGDRFRISDATFEIRAVIAGEPDRSVSGVPLGPRVITSIRGFRATGLITEGSMVTFRYRVRLPEGADLTGWKSDLAETFPNAHWHVRDWHDSAPGLTSLIDRMALFFALTGITTLIVAGLGIGNAAGVYVWSRRDTIATLKCLGASQSHIYLVYLIQLLIVGVVAIAYGLAVGTLGEMALVTLFSNLLPVGGERGVYAEPLILSAGLGLLTLLLFSLLPLAQTAPIKPAALFRGYLHTAMALPFKNVPVMTIMGVLIIGMIWLAVLFTHTLRIPLYFAAGLAVSLLVFYAISEGIKRAALQRAHKGWRLTVSMALANLSRPGAATASMVVALGIGMTLMIALTLVGGNLRHEMEEGLPEHAPAFFLLDIQPGEREQLLDKLKAIPQVQCVTDLPIVRGHIVRLNGQPTDRMDIAESARWALQSERGLTWAAAPPENAHIVRGKWWSADYRGPPLVSFDANLARGMGLKLGDTITIAALDKEITATIASLRDIQWGTMQMNFAIMLSPGALDGLPATYIATVSVPLQGQKAVEAMLAQDFPMVAIVHVREALGKLSSMLRQISNAVLAAAAMTVICGVLVMGSAVHASLSRRIFDTVMLKVLGVTRRRILGIYLTEFALVALAVAAASALIGALAAWAIMQLMIFSDFALMPSVLLMTLIGSLALALLLGFIATHITLGVRPLALLRNE
ncbi:MAG: ABC transporter permease [Pseudomonadota bacterium]|nr:ABC transporter permease [Pseudomonadota bacterium]